MIEQSEIMPSLLELCPDFRPRWEEHLQYWGDDERGIFIDTAEFVHYLVASYERGNTGDFPAVFSRVEAIITNGTPEARAAAVLGILETLQTVASHYTFGEDVFIRYLKPASKSEWDQIALQWQGKSSLADVIRAEKKQ